MQDAENAIIIETIYSLNTPIFKVKLIRRIIKKRYGIEISGQKIREVLLGMRVKGLVSIQNKNGDGALWRLEYHKNVGASSSHK